MKIVFASDHAGFVLKNELIAFVRDLGYEVDDTGTYEKNMDDDYPSIVARVAREVSKDSKNTNGIILGGSGQGEAIVANRFPNVRAVVYYGGSENIIKLSKEHNDANILSLGARFLEVDEAKDVVKLWLGTNFSKEERHIRRIKDIEKYSKHD